MALEPELEHTHRQTLSSQQVPPLQLSRGSNRWQVLAEGDLASINRHTELLLHLERKQWEGPSAAGSSALLWNPSWGLTEKFSSRLFTTRTRYFTSWSGSTLFILSPLWWWSYSLIALCLQVCLHTVLCPLASQSSIHFKLLLLVRCWSPERGPQHREFFF